jgi:RNA polymerase sigma-70 factor (ECF subfamily)
MMGLTMADGDARGSPGAARGHPDELDRATLARCRLKDPEAFRAFVVRYERPVFACLSRMLGHGPHVEDLAQEVFLRAYSALPSFDPDGVAKPSTWLLTIATRAALDARKRRVIPTQSLGPENDAAHTTTPETERTRAELGRAIERALATLADDQRAAVVLAEWHGCTMGEIAEIMGVKEATVKTRLFRAREAMRATLGDEWREP